MGRVWRGRDERLDREVAVKEVLLSDDLPSTARERQIARTVREAQAAARLRHPGIVTVHDVTLHEGVPWIVMELLPGPSLAALIAHEGRLDRGRVAAFGADVADALAHAHAAGIVHRDLKPDNVLMDGDRTVITDFGIARILDASGPLTSVGVIMGTPRFMAPEQLAGDQAEAPADLWALGATLYAAVEGHPPYPGRTWTEISEAIRTGPPPSAPHAGPLGELLAALLTKLPSARPDAATAARRLRATLDLHDTGTQGPDATATRTRRQPPREPTRRPGRRPSRRAVVLGGISTLVAATGGSLLALHLADDDDPVDLSPWRTFGGYTESVSSVAFTPDGKTVIGGSAGEIRLWDLKTGTSTGAVSEPDGFGRVALGPDGKSLAIGGRSGAIHLWDLNTKRALGSLAGHTDTVNCLAFSPDGGTLASGSDDSTARLWDLATGSNTATLTGHTGGVPSVAFSPDGKALASCGGRRSGDSKYDENVLLWDVATRTTTATLHSSTGQVFSLAFSPDGKTLACGSGDDSRYYTTATVPNVQLWDARTMSAKAVIFTNPSSRRVTSVAFSPDGRTLASGDNNGALELWKPSTQTKTATLTAYMASVPSLVFSPDGKTLAAATSALRGGPGAAQEAVRLWKLP